jgi:hypothetical protein
MPVSSTCPEQHKPKASLSLCSKPTFLRTGSDPACGPSMDLPPGGCKGPVSVHASARVCVFVLCSNPHLEHHARVVVRGRDAHAHAPALRELKRVSHKVVQDLCDEGRDGNRR